MRLFLLAIIASGCASTAGGPSHAQPASVLSAHECSWSSRAFANVKEEGEVVVAVELDRTAEIQKITVVSSPSQAASDAAVRALRLDPACRFKWAKDADGNPIATQVRWVFQTESKLHPEPTSPRLDAAATAKVKWPEIDAAKCGAGVSYPAAAQAEGAGGTVQLDVHIEADGRVSKATVRKSVAPALDEAALRAIQSDACRFTPATQDGHPIAADIVYTFKFGD